MGSLNKNTILERLSQELPSVFGKAVPQLLPGVYKYQTLCNLESEGAGPPSMKIGKKICYKRDSFLRWLGDRFRTRMKTNLRSTVHYRCLLQNMGQEWGKMEIKKGARIEWKLYKYYTVFY